VPHENFADAVREACESYWSAAGGPTHRLHLWLDPVFLQSTRVRNLCDAIGLLLRAGLSQDFSPCRDNLGVNLWLTRRLEGILLIADDRDGLANEPLTTDVVNARKILGQADCRLVWVPAHGTVWRIHIPLDMQERARSRQVHQHSLVIGRQRQQSDVHIAARLLAPGNERLGVGERR
jgi:hypothetical protein